jgi:hypothetical protein
MASELLKNRALIQRLKEPEVSRVKFNLASTGFEELFTLPEPKPQELLDIQEDVRIQKQQDTMNKARPFLMDESVDFIEREEFADGADGRVRVPATEENLKKLDNLIKNTNLKVEEIAVRMGFTPGGFRLSPGTKNTLVKKYLEEYGPIPEGRFKITKLTGDEAIIKKAIELKESGLSTVQVADELNTDRTTIHNYFRKGGREDLVGPINVKREGGDTPRQKATKVRKEKIKFGEKFASKLDKEFNKKEKKRVEKINEFVSKNLDDLSKNKKLVNLINLKLDKKGNILSKEKTLEEIKKSLKTKRFFERDHISSVAKKKRNMQFPVNFQMSPYNINQGFFTAVETYAKRPDADPAKLQKISSVLNQYGLRLDTGKGIIGAKQIPASEVIDRNLKALDLPTDIGKKIKIPMQESGQKKLTALQKLASGKNVGFDPILATRAGFEEFVKPAASIAKRGALTGLDLALSAGAGPIGLGVGALIETGQAMPELTRGNIKEAGRRTIIGSLLPESLVGSMQTDLLKLAETPEEKIAMQNFIDFKKDEAKYGTSVKNLRYLENNPFEAEGIDLDILRNKVLEQKADLENRAPKVFFPEFAQEIYPTLVRRLDAQNVENLEGFLGSVVGRGGIDRRDKIIQEIGEQGISGQEPFYGQAPVQMSPEELDEIYESGIMAMANGGRIGFADGPDDPSKRTFLKIMGGIASLPIVGKFFKSAKVAKVVPLKNTTTVMPEWFPQFVEKALAKGVSKKIDADLTEIEIPELPDVKVRAHDDGRIQVEGKNAYNEEYYIDYEPPGYVVVDETTGKAVKKPGDFVATDTEYRMISPEDYDIDGVNVDEIDDILGGSSTKLEGFAKGTNKEKYTTGQKRIDEADARGASKDESLRADINDPYGDIDPTDFTDD